MLSIPPVESLADATVGLRPISDWDIPEILIAHQDDRQLATDLGLKRPPSGAALGREVEEAPTEWAAGTLKLTLLTPGSDDCRGRLTIELSPTGPHAMVTTLWIVPGLRGRGLARAAVQLAGDWLARSAGVEQLECGEDGSRRG